MPPQKYSDEYIFSCFRIGNNNAYIHRTFGISNARLAALRRQFNQGKDLSEPTCKDLSEPCEIPTTAAPIPLLTRDELRRILRRGIPLDLQKKLEALTES